MTAILEVENVSLRFSGIVALASVSLTVDAGELMAIVGPNGAGKTSLLNCITGAYHVSDGRIAFQGTDITAAAPHTAAKRGIARTFQHNELFPQLTTLENLLLGRHASLNYDLLSAGVYLGRSRSWELRQREKVERSSSSLNSNRSGSRLWETFHMEFKSSSAWRAHSQPNHGSFYWTSHQPD